jgi:hypothetical protein
MKPTWVMKKQVLSTLLYIFEKYIQIHLKHLVLRLGYRFVNFYSIEHFPQVFL